MNSHLSFDEQDHQMDEQVEAFRLLLEEEEVYHLLILQ